MRFRLTSFHKKSAFSATAHSENSESGRLSYFIQFFVWFHIVCDRYASDHAHFTFFNLIWPLSLSWVFEIQTNGYTEKLSYDKYKYKIMKIIVSWVGQSTTLALNKYRQGLVKLFQSFLTKAMGCKSWAKLHILEIFQMNL